MKKAKPLQLPPDISVVRQGQTYVISKDGVGEIGGVVLNGTSQGDTQLKPYLKGDQGGNKEIVAFVSQQMADALLSHVASKPAHLQRDPYYPDNIPEGTEVLENTLFPCSKCGDITARLVFVYDVSSASGMHIMSKKFELEAFVSTYPIWLIGAPDSEDEENSKHLTLQIAPVKGEVYWEHPDIMNARLEELDVDHCQSRVYESNLSNKKKECH